MTAATPANTLPSYRMGRIVLVAGLAMFFLAACSKQEEVPAPAAEEPSATVAPAATQVSDARVDDGTATALAAELTQVVRKYAAEKQRAPQSFEEIVAAGYLPRVPAAPRGQKFVIDKKLQVTLTAQ
ncbi:MAG: hypothetical protein ACXW3Z_00620 [Limisphaerales bacterium]